VNPSISGIKYMGYPKGCGRTSEMGIEIIIGVKGLPCEEWLCRL